MKLYCADCMDILKGIPEGSIDMILCDLPYGTTRNKWDVIIPLEPLWAQYRRIIKSNGVIALHGDMPFTAALVSAGKDLYRYELIWVKENGSDFLNANRKPLKAHESIQIFYKHQPTYNKQYVDGKPYKNRGGQRRKASPNWGKFRDGILTDCSDGKRNPTTILKFPREKGLHPTQKPVKLEEWLIKTYTNPGETVLDNCMGSGTTGVACINTNRDFIGIEKNPDYYKTAISRIKEAQDNGKQGNQKKQPDHD